MPVGADGDDAGVPIALSFGAEEAREGAGGGAMLGLAAGGSAGAVAAGGVQVGGEAGGFADGVDQDAEDEEGDEDDVEEGIDHEGAEDDGIGELWGRMDDVIAPSADLTSGQVLRNVIFPSHSPWLRSTTNPSGADVEDINTSGLPSPLKSATNNSASEDPKAPNAKRTQTASRIIHQSVPIFMCAAF